VGEESRAGEGGERRVWLARAGGGTGEGLERRWQLAAEGQRAEQGSKARCERKKKRERGLRDLLGICKNLRDLTVNWIFPHIQSSNEEINKIEVVEFFKSYNFTLGFKFKNLKHNALFYHFALKSNLNKFCPY
jgi:hypothetical protein